MLLDWTSSVCQHWSSLRRRNATRKRKHLHVVHLRQPYAKLTTGTPRGLRRVGHTDYELYPAQASPREQSTRSPRSLDRKRGFLTSAASPCIFRAPAENKFFLPSKKARGLKTEGAVMFCRRCTISCPRRLFKSASRPGRSVRGLMTIQRPLGQRARERLRIKSQRTHYGEVDTMVSELSGSPPSSWLTVIVKYGLCGERPNGKRVRNDFNGSSGCAVLARGGYTALRGLRS